MMAMPFHRLPVAVHTRRGRVYHAVTRNKFGGIDGVSRLYLIRSFFNHR